VRPRCLLPAASCPVVPPVAPSLNFSLALTAASLLGLSVLPPNDGCGISQHPYASAALRAAKGASYYVITTLTTDTPVFNDRRSITVPKRAPHLIATGLRGQRHAQLLLGMGRLEQQLGSSSPSACQPNAQTNPSVPNLLTPESSSTSLRRFYAMLEIAKQHAHAFVQPPVYENRRACTGRPSAWRNIHRTVHEQMRPPTQANPHHTTP